MTSDRPAREATANLDRLHRAVRLTARTSGLLFAAAVSTAAIRPSSRRAAQGLYAGFATAHAVHFAAVSRFALATGGRSLFPGGRSLTDVGGWPTVLAIYATFGALVATGRTAVASPRSSRSRSAVTGRLAIGVIGAMFVGTYLGQSARSRWFAVPAALIGLAVTANLLTDRARRPGSTPTRVGPRLA